MPKQAQAKPKSVKQGVVYKTSTDGKSTPSKLPEGVIKNGPKVVINDH